MVVDLVTKSISSDYAFDDTKSLLAKVSQESTIDLAMALGMRLKYPDQSSPLTLPSSLCHQTPSKTDDEGHT